MSVWKGLASLGLVLGGFVVSTASIFYPSAGFCVIREAPRTTVDEAFAAGHIPLAGYTWEELVKLSTNLRELWLKLDQQKGPSHPDTQNVRSAHIVVGQEIFDREFPGGIHMHTNRLRAERAAAENAAGDQKREARAKELLDEVRGEKGQGPSTG